MSAGRTVWRSLLSGSTVLATSFCILSTVMPPTSAIAQTTDATVSPAEPARRPRSDAVVIGAAQADGGGRGRIAVNGAAGDNNQQANVAIVAVGATALATGAIVQSLDTAPRRGAATSAFLGDGAFAGSRGLTSVNIVAGSNNQQANLAVIAFGIEGGAIADAMLSQTRASKQPNGGPADRGSPERQAGIAPGAFEDSRGLVQVSLIGGERNSSANIFALAISGGAKP